MKTDDEIVEETHARLKDLYEAYEAEQDFQVKGDFALEIRQLNDILEYGCVQEENKREYDR